MDAIVLADKGNMEVGRPSITMFVDQYLTAQDIKPKSRETYRKALKDFLKYLSSIIMHTDLLRETILDYKNNLIQRGLSAYTISCYLTAVRKFFEYAEAVKVYPNIARGIKGAKRPRGFNKDALTLEQVATLLNSIERDSLQGKRDYALLNLLIRTGLRTIEVIRADIQDIRQVGGDAILNIQGKGRDTKDAYVLLTDETLKPIMDYLQARGKTNDTDPLFASLSDRNRNNRLTTRSISRIVKTYLIKAGLCSKRLTAHSLRHTAITLSLLGGATIQEAQLLARHSDINTTLIYAHNIDRLVRAPERKIDALLSGLSDNHNNPNNHCKQHKHNKHSIGYMTKSNRR